MNIRNNVLDELKLLQPELNVIGNVISGCFYVNACLENKTKGRGKKIALYSWNTATTRNKKHIKNFFYVDIILDESMYPQQTFETSEKLLAWKNLIPSEFWHINSDNTLCLGIKSDIEQKLQNANSFATFINQLLTEYFYYMCYVKDFHSEPWEAYRHGLFSALELANESIERNAESICMILTSDNGIWGAKDEWTALLKKTKTSAVKYKHDCHFCKVPTLVRDCKAHKKQTKGYNKIIQHLSSFQSKK